MKIDLPTLMLAGSFVSTLSGIFLLFAWAQNRDEPGTAWWAAGTLVLAIAVPLLTLGGDLFGISSNVIGVLLLNISPALIWAAARSCNGHRPNLSGVLAGAVIWLFAVAVPPISEAPQGQMALNLAVISFYLLAAATEFWRGREVRLQTRWPLVILLFLHGIYFVFGAVQAIQGNLNISGGANFASWFGLIHFETLAFVVGTAIFAAAMANERGEMRSLAAARTDPLTGAANRRAFIETAEAKLEAFRERGVPLSLLLFDLDWFKAVNDHFGHGCGDDVLRRFADVARNAVRSTDLISRLGGEEFAALLPGSEQSTSAVIADRIRLAFADACRALDGRILNATVSVGVATAGPGSTVDSLLLAADKALYRAKENGRNRVEIAEPVVAVAERPIELARSAYAG
jgi:diguanylate cyclase (GGDEF)-like protein